MARKAKPKLKLSPKLIELSNWKNIEVVNNMLDAGESPNNVCKFINQNGFKISAPMVYEYAKIRKQAIVSHISMDHILGVAAEKAKGIKIEKTESFNSKQKQLKSEIDMLDEIINKGYQDWREIFMNKPVTMAMTMNAIKMKNDLTNSSHGFLTNYGMEQLRELEKQKYEVLIDLIMSYVPEELREQVAQEVDAAEDEYYRNTEYYEEYLKARGYTEEEINQRIYELERQEHLEELEHEKNDTTDGEE